MSYDYGFCDRPTRTPEYEKDPSDTIDYPLSWHQLGTDTIVTSVWTTDGLSIVSDTVDGLTTTVFVSGGTAGAVHSVTNQIVTGMGRTLERTIYIAVSDL